MNVIALTAVHQLHTTVLLRMVSRQASTEKSDEIVQKKADEVNMLMDGWQTENYLAQRKTVMASHSELKPGDKFMLTVSEAAKYFNIGEGKLRNILSDHSDAKLCILSGNRVLINRKAFEKFLEAATEV